MNTTDVAVGGLSLAGVVTATPLGLPMPQIAVGTLFAVLGVVGRAAFEVQRYGENTGTMKWPQMMAWLGGGLVSAPTITVLYEAFLKSISVDNDSLAIFGLIFLGWTGPKGARWLLGLIRGTIQSKLGSAPDEGK